MKLNSNYMGNFWLGIVIPLLSILGLYIGFYWWRYNSVPDWIGKIGVGIAIIGVLIGVYYSLSWIPNAFNSDSDSD